MEQDIETLSGYVNFSLENMPTYSLDMARILLAAGAEADVLLKGICEREEPTSNADSIGAYFKVLHEKLPSMFEFEAQLSRWGMSMIPWEQWTKKGPPDWWTSYNKVKHHRATYFQRANLQYALEAVSGVYVLNLYRDPDAARKGDLRPIPSIFRPGPANHCSTIYEDFEFGINYKL